MAVPGCEPVIPGSEPKHHKQIVLLIAMKLSFPCGTDLKDIKRLYFERTGSLTDFSLIELK